MKVSLNGMCCMYMFVVVFFFFQAEDGIRDGRVTGVQTCALPILPEGTVNFIQCTYTVREFINVFAYRGCSMFMWEMVDVMRKMREAILEQSPWLEPYIKISCEKTGTVCEACGGDGKNVFMVDTYGEECPDCNGQGRIGAKCTFQGWESPEGQCDKPWAKDEQRSFKPLFHTIGRRPGLK